MRSTSMIVLLALASVLVEVAWAGGLFHPTLAKSYAPKTGQARALPGGNALSTWKELWRVRFGGEGFPPPKKKAPAPSSPVAASGEYAGYTPDQIEFLKRKKGETGMTGGLDTHGRPRAGWNAAPASASGEYAGYT